MGGDDDAGTKRFKSGGQVRVVARKVFDESAGFDGAPVAEEEVREATDRFNVPRPHLHGQSIGLFGFSGVVAISEKIGLSDEAVTVKKAEIIEVAASSEAILGDDDVPLSIAGFIEKRRNKASRIGATHKHHARPKRAEHGVAIVEELLRGPIMGGFGDTEGLEDRFFRCWSRWRDVRSAACRAEWQPVARVSRAAGKACRIMALVARRDTFSTFGAAAAQKPAGTPDTSTTPRGPRTETR